MTRALLMRRAHGLAALVWAVLVVPSLLWWKDSVPYVVAVSVYANLVNHLAAWQAARVEVNQGSTSPPSGGSQHG